MWSHDHDYFTTECRRTETTTTTTLPNYADDFVLSPQGEANCTSVCEDRGMTCTAQGFRDAYDQISNYSAVSRIVAAIGRRDWLGLQQEKIFPQCLKDGGSWGYRLWPGTWGSNWGHFDCLHWSGDIPDDHCAPSNPGGGWRRLCKCVSTSTSTTTTFPAGYTQVGTDAMCTDEAHTAWNEGIEIGTWPRSHQSSMQACAERCEATHGCNGFVFWNGTAGGHCRTYRACSTVLCQDCHEYRGSIAARRTVLRVAA